MKSTLIGYTGFVGSNLCSQHNFDFKYNSKNIEDAFQEQHDLVIYAGIRAEKFLANSSPDKDLKHIEEAESIISKLKFKKLVLVSTIDVYKNPNGVNENTAIETENLHAYGLHRFLLEKWVSENVADYHILRLPALFGEKLKKNFIFDMIALIPSMLKQDKWEQLCRESELVFGSYSKMDNGFYRLDQKDPNQLHALRDFFDKSNFNALSFTDSRNQYPFYNLNHLYAHIGMAISNDIQLLNVSVPPIQAGELYQYIFNRSFDNQILQSPACYDMRSIYAKKIFGLDDYFSEKNAVMQDLKSFVLSHLEHQHISSRSI